VGRAGRGAASKTGRKCRRSEGRSVLKRNREKPIKEGKKGVAMNREKEKHPEFPLRKNYTERGGGLLHYERRRGGQRGTPPKRKDWGTEEKSPSSERGGSRFGKEERSANLFRPFGSGERGIPGEVPRKIENPKKKHKNQTKQNQKKISKKTWKKSPGQEQVSQESGLNIRRGPSAVHKRVKEGS